MKLTKTQRNFRKQMKGRSPSATPYDNSRDGNPFLRAHKPKSKSTSFFLLIFFAILFVFAFKNWSKLGFESLTSSSAVNIAQSPLVTQTTLPASKNPNTALSSSDASYLQTLKSFMTHLKEPWQKVSEHHQIPWDQRNVEQYQVALLNGIAACDQALIGLEGVQRNTKFEGLKSISKEYVSYSRLSFKSYLDYSYSQNPSDIALGNKYTTLTNQTSAKFNSTLIQLLKQHGYAYEDNGNGQVRYYIRP